LTQTTSKLVAQHEHRARTHLPYHLVPPSPPAAARFDLALPASMARRYIADRSSTMHRLRQETMSDLTHPKSHERRDGRHVPATGVPPTAAPHTGPLCRMTKRMLHRGMEETKTRKSLSRWMLMTRRMIRVRNLQKRRKKPRRLWSPYAMAKARLLDRRQAMGPHQMSRMGVASI
jgi:hypothetical protein